MVAVDRSLTTFERRLKAALAAAVAAALVSPFDAATFVGMYVLSEVTLTELVCPRNWRMRLAGIALAVAFSEFLRSFWWVPRWVTYLPPLASFVLSAWAFVHPLAFFRFYGCQFRPGTDILIARVVEQGPEPTKEGAVREDKISWHVRSNVALEQDQLRTIKERFCNGAPWLCFGELSSLFLDLPPPTEPQKKFYFRSVQFRTDQEGRLTRRVSAWSAPQVELEFDYLRSPVQRIDDFLSTYFWTACLLAGLFVSVHSEADITPWYVLLLRVSLVWGPNYLVSWSVEAGCNLFIWAARLCLSVLFRGVCSRVRWMWSAAKGVVKAGARWTKAVVSGIRSGAAWTCNCIKSGCAWACKVAAKAGRTVAKGLKHCLPVARRLVALVKSVAGTAFLLLGLVTNIAITASAGLLVLVLLWLFVSAVSRFVAASLLWLWDVVPVALGAAAESFSFCREMSMQSVARAAEASAVGAAQASAVAWAGLLGFVACSWRTALAVGVLGVAAGFARAFVLFVRAGRDVCVGLVASWCKEQEPTLRKACDARRCCRRPMLLRVEQASAIAPKAASGRDVERREGEEQQPQANHGKRSLREIRELSQRLYLEQKASKNAPAAAVVAGSSSAAPLKRGRCPAATVCSASASAPVLRRSPRTRSGTS